MIYIKLKVGRGIYAVTYTPTKSIYIYIYMYIWPDQFLENNIENNPQQNPRWGTAPYLRKTSNNLGFRKDIPL